MALWQIMLFYQVKNVKILDALFISFFIKKGWIPCLQVCFGLC